jgi:hypothetical protein
MKLVVVFCFCLFLLTSCNDTVEQSYIVEDKILQCIYDQSAADGVDAKAALDEIEGALVAYGVLEDASGESYYKLIIALRDDHFAVVEEINGALSEVEITNKLPESVDCLTGEAAGFTEEEFSNSKFKYIVAITDSIMDRRNIVYADIVNEFLQVLTVQDFEHEYYHMMFYGFLATSANMINRDTGLTRPLPPPAKEKELEALPQNVLGLFLYDDDLFVYGEETELSELEALIFDFMLDSADQEEVNLPTIGEEMKTRGQIELQPTLQTSFDLYVEVQDIVAKAIKELRNRRALKLFGVPYEEADENQVKVLRLLIPMKIIEAEPIHIGC